MHTQRETHTNTKTTEQTKGNERTKEDIHIEWRQKADTQMEKDFDTHTQKNKWMATATPSP